MTIFSKDDVIITPGNIYQIEPMDVLKSEEPMKGYCYIKENYFYPYYGLCKPKYPGIYKKANGELDIVEPNDTNKKEYLVDTHISNINPDKIIEVLQNKDDILISLPESSRTFMPELNKEDDILKRAIKMALIAKGIDIDQYKHRFTDKNSLFNFKQVIKGPSKLSMLLFERGAEALNLNYSIIIEELDQNNIIGNKLNAPIKVSSNDTFEL